MVILDTDVLVGVIRNDGDAVNKLSQLEHEGIDLSTTAITAFELVEGAHISRKAEDNIALVEGLIDDLSVYYFDKTCGRIAGKLSAELTKEGKTIDYLDIMIASIALVKDEALVTRNVKHFSRIGGLKIEKW